MTRPPYDIGRRQIHRDTVLREEEPGSGSPSSRARLADACVGRPAIEHRHTAADVGFHGDGYGSTPGGAALEGGTPRTW
jgi:hypothetical protein